MRADAYSRHLFASDASMYAREPLAVAFPRDADDVAAAIARRRRASSVPVVTRGAGTSLAGQTIGAARASCSTRRATWTRSARSTPEALRVRVGPGVVQEDLNRAAHRHGLGFGPDTSTSNRATIGGMIGNNSSGSHSIVYGTTIDHVHELEVVLADGSRATLGPVDEAEWRAGRGDHAGRRDHRGPQILRDHARRDRRAATRSHWRQSGGYRLDRLAAATFDLAQARDRLRGHAGGDHRGHGRAGRRCRRRGMFAVGHFDSVAAAIAATDDALELEAAAIELIDRTILELSRSKLEYRRLSETLEGDPRRCCSSPFFGGQRGRGARAARPPRGGWRRTARLPHAARRDGGRAGGAHEGAQGRASGC